jgi:hypothetical protein
VKTDVSLNGRHSAMTVGCGVDGVFASRALRPADVDVTLIGRSNHHLFQPVLYPMATGILAAVWRRAPGSSETQASTIRRTGTSMNPRPDDRIITARRGANLVSVAQRTGGWQRRATHADASPKRTPEPPLARRYHPRPPA